MEDIIVLKGMMIQAYYNQYHDVLAKIVSLEDEHKAVLQAIDRYYRRYPDEDQVSLEELQAFYKKYCSDLLQGEVINLLWRQIRDSEINNQELIKDSIDLLVEKHIVGKIEHAASLLLDQNQGTVIDKITKYVEEYEELTGGLQGEEEDDHLDIEKFVEQQQQEGLPWAIEGLNQIIGPLGPGTLTHIFARTHVGKTGFVVTHMANWVKKLQDDESNRVILYCTNEESSVRVAIRVVQAYFDEDKYYYTQKPRECNYRLQTYIRPHLIMENNINDMRQVVSLIRKYNPVAVIIDQGPKVNIRGDYPRHEKLQIVYQNYREMAVKYNTRIITLGQADAQAENRKYVGVTNIDGAKTGMPGELDLAIGIGAMLDDTSRANMRWINVCKNKINFETGHCTAYIRPDTGAYQ